MDKYYKLDENKNPVPCSIEEYASDHEDFEKRKRVGREKYKGYDISTVFLGLNHDSGGESPKPIVFETMVFGDLMNDDEYQTRCCTWVEALGMHQKAKNWVDKRLEVGGEK